MAPGPRVMVHENLATLQTNAEFENVDADDDEDSTPRYQYYRSHKVLGQLYRAIDEEAFLTEIRSAIGPSDSTASNVLSTLWTYVKYETSGFVFDHLLETAREIKNMYFILLRLCKR